MSNLDTPPAGPDKDKYLTQPEREQLQRLLSQPEEFPRELGSWITDYVGTNAFLQKSQVQGLPLLNTQVADALETLETTVETLSVIGTTYSDAAADSANVNNGVAADPVVAVPAGTYFCIYTAQAQINDGGGSLTAQLYNASGATTFGNASKLSSDSVPSNIVPLICIGTVTVSGSSNDIKVTYTKSGSGQRAVTSPLLVALRTG